MNILEGELGPTTNITTTSQDLYLCYLDTILLIKMS